MAAFPTVEACRIVAISDLHVDYKENMEFVKSWKREHYRNDAIIVAGDVTDNMQLLETTLRLLKNRFAEVFFVPGNHELWIRPKETARDSVSKFKAILKLCDRIGVHTRPARVLLQPPAGRDDEADWQNTSLDSSRSASPGSDPGDTHTDRTMDWESHRPSHVWIVPLYSWYSTPEEDLCDTLYCQPKLWKENPEASEKMWMDNVLCKWPSSLPGRKTRSQYFAAMNEPFLDQSYDGPVISFSHMLPRRDLMKPDEKDQRFVNHERHRRGLGDAPKFTGPPGGFNFSRYAGAQVIENQLRQLGSVVHVFGHQHRNRDRTIGGVRYVQYCLGNCKEQQEGWMYGLTDCAGPKQIWAANQL